MGAAARADSRGAGLVRCAAPAANERGQIGDVAGARAIARRPAGGERIRLGAESRRGSEVGGCRGGIPQHRSIRLGRVSVRLPHDDAGSASAPWPALRRLSLLAGCRAELRQGYGGVPRASGRQRGDGIRHALERPAASALADGRPGFRVARGLLAIAAGGPGLAAGPAAQQCPAPRLRPCRAPARDGRASSAAEATGERHPAPSHRRHPPAGGCACRGSPAGGHGLRLAPRAAARSGALLAISAIDVATASAVSAAAAATAGRKQILGSDRRLVAERAPLNSP